MSPVQSRTLLALVAVGCVPRMPDGPGQDGPFFDAEPTIDSLSWSCAGDEGVWHFDVRTEGWTGGGRLWMAREPETAERHKVYSIGAAADGSSDHLYVELEVSADWRDAVPDESTRWQCGDVDALSYLFAILDPTGEARTDCRTWGADPDLFAEVSGATPCETLLASDTGA